MALNITLPALAPTGASMVVDHSFPSLAMEVISLTDYAGIYSKLTANVPFLISINRE